MTSFGKLKKLVDFSNELAIKSNFQKVSYKEISKLTNLSLHNVKKIMNECKDKKISKITPSINYPLLRMYTAVIVLKSKDNKYNDEITEELVKTRYIHYVYEVISKEETHIIKVKVPKFKELRRLSDHLIDSFSDKVEWTKTMIASRIFLEEEKIYDSPTDELKTPKMDWYDWVIIKELLEDSTKSLKTISKKLGLTVPTVFRRIKKLEEGGVINGYRCTRQWATIPYEFWPVHVVCNMWVTYKDMDRIMEKLASFDRRKNEVLYVYKTFGGYDIIFFLKSKTIDDFRDFASVLLKEKGVKNLDTLVVTKMKSRFWFSDAINHLEKKGDIVKPKTSKIKNS